MLAASDMLGMVKPAQFFGGSPVEPEPTLGDLVAAIKADRGLTAVEQQRVLAELAARAGAQPLSTPISSLMFGGLGGILGAVITRYFGLGSAAQAISAMAGFGVGTALYNKLNAPPDPYKGYRMIGG